MRCMGLKICSLILCSLQINFFFLTWDPTGLLECCEELTVQSTTIERALSITIMFFRATL